MQKKYEKFMVVIFILSNFAGRLNGFTFKT